MSGAKMENKNFHIMCKGRDASYKETLPKEIPVTVYVRLREDQKTIAMSVDCPHNTGGHGQRCKASHPGVDKVGDGILCPYSADIPRVIDYFEEIIKEEDDAIIKGMLIPAKELPLHINDPSPTVRGVVKSRLENGI